MSGPADQARFGQFSNYGVLRSTGLLGVGGDDFKIPSCAEREEGVLRAASRPNAARMPVRSSTKAMPRSRSLQPKRMWSSEVGTSFTAQGNAGIAKAQPATRRNSRREMNLSTGGS